jgi:hypothetical protein
MKGEIDMVIRRLMLAGLLAVVGAACGDSGSRDGMEDMPGTEPAGQPSAEAADAMQAQLARMAALPADSLSAVMPAHRQMVANMLARMNREMAGMNMASDAAWNGTVDSIRADLTTMPTMSGSELAELMSAHVGRVRRLMTMHAAMMGR